MTKENRENAYKHFRDLEKNYEALSHLNSGMTATQRIRKESKKTADALLLKNPELAELDKAVEVKEEVKPVEEKKTKSKVKK